jgi:hypothetical protein
MVLPGLLIEYLISGALALIWFVPVLERFGISIILDAPLPILLVALYVLGMAVDFAAYWLVKWFKRFPRELAVKNHGGSNKLPSSVECDVQFALYAPDVAKEVSMRSSRDRVARGILLNALIVLGLSMFDVVELSPTFALVVAVFASLMWFAFEYISFAYVIRAERALREKRATATSLKT